jgi:hypothetical protein
MGRIETNAALTLEKVSCIPMRFWKNAFKNGGLMSEFMFNRLMTNLNGQLIWLPVLFGIHKEMEFLGKVNHEWDTVIVSLV